MDIPDTRLESTSTDQLWMENYRKLEAFRKANGHCNVTTMFEDKSLAFWVSNQRSAQRAGILRRDREQLLNDLGFIFRHEVAAATQLPWIARYNKLVEFKQKHGHFSVPLAEDVTMNNWVNQQRKKFRLGKLGKDKVDLLDKIEFTWRVHAAPSNRASLENSSGSVSSKKSTAATAQSVTAGTVNDAKAVSEAAKPSEIIRLNDEPPKIDQKFAFGTRIEKVFEVDGVSGVFGGNVVAFERFQEEDGKISWGYLIHYDDGDEEHMLEANVAKTLVVVKRVRRAAKNQTKPKPSKRMKEVNETVTNNDTSIALEKKVTNCVASQANTDVSEKPETTVHTNKSTENDSCAAAALQDPAKPRKDSTTDKSSRAESSSRAFYARDAKLSLPFKEATKRSLEAPSRSRSKIVAKEKETTTKQRPLNTRETESLSSADEPLYSLVRQSKLSSEIDAKSKQNEKQMQQQEVIELLDDEEEPAATVSKQEQPTLNHPSSANASTPRQRFPKDTLIARTFFDLSDNEQEKSYGGKVVDYVYAKEDKDWVYFVRYDDGDTEFMDEWEVAKFSSSITS